MQNMLLSELIRSRAQQRARPDGSPYAGLSLADARTLAGQTGFSLAEVEGAALKDEVLPERYSRNQKSLSCSDQLKLLHSHVAIIGLGGLGGTVVEILARLGVGQLTVVDGDVFDESNLNRQLLSSPSRIGEKKALAARARIEEINPAVTVRAVEAFFTTDNGSEILTGINLAVDCLDTIPARFILEQECRRASIPMVSAAIAGASGQATAVFPDDPGLELLYGPPEKVRLKGIEASSGTLPFAAVYMAAVECAEITTILLGRQSGLRHRLLLAEISDHSSELVDLSGQK